MPRNAIEDAKRKQDERKQASVEAHKKDAKRKRVRRQSLSVEDKTKDATRKRAKRAKRKSPSVEDKAIDAKRKRAKRLSLSFEDKAKDATRKRAKRQRVETECKTTTAEVSATSKDAKEYAEALSEHCNFVMCACCGYESGESEFRKLTEELKETMQNKMFLSWDLFCQENHNSSFMVAAESEMDAPGFLKGITHVCKHCIKNGKGFTSWFVGQAPLCLSSLNQIEVSMISLVNPVVKFIVVRGSAVKCKANVFSVTNDVQHIATNLPRMPGPEWAICRSKSSSGGTSVTSYRPARVKEALVWLHQNNYLYKDIILNFDLLPDSDQVDVKTCQFDEDDSEMNDECEVSEEFIMQNDSNQPVISAMRALTTLEKLPGDKVQPHLYPNYEALAFPVLFPYGKGCCAIIDRKYIRHRLTQVRMSARQSIFIIDNVAYFMTLLFFRETDDSRKTQRTCSLITLYL